MPCAILVGTDRDGRPVAAMYDTVTMWAFGPVVHRSGGSSPERVLQVFMDCLPVDNPRALSDAELNHAWGYHQSLPRI